MFMGQNQNMVLKYVDDNANFSFKYFYAILSVTREKENVLY